MKKSLFFIVLIALIISIVIVSNKRQSSLPETRSLYVSAEGDDHNNGTKAHPFKTLQKASKEATKGTTVFIRGGTYKEGLTIKHSGTSTSPIVFRPYKKERVILDGRHIPQKEEETALVKIQDKSYITIQGLEIRNLSTSLTDQTPMGIYVTGEGTGIKLLSNKVHHIKTTGQDGNAHGIAVYGTKEITNLTIKGNLLEQLTLGSSESLVLNGNVSNFSVSNNTVRYSDNIGIDLIGYEQISKKHDYVRNGKIENNIVHHISSYGNPAYGEDYAAGGIYIDGGHHLIVSNNVVYKSDIGIEATSEHKGKDAQDITISHNTLYNNDYTGISIGGYDKKRGGTKNSLITHNVLYKNDLKELGGGQLLLQYNTKGNTIENNIFTASSSGIFISNDFKENKNNYLNRNVYDSRIGEDAIWTWKKQEVYSLSQFKKLTNSDKKSIFANPHYKDEKEFNFSLKNGTKVDLLIP
jgi:hypothetical protein